MSIRFSPRPGCIVGALFCALAAGSSPAPRDFEFRHENVLGTSLELCVRADNEEAAGLAEARTLAEIDRLATVFSGYDPSSEFRRWQATINQPTKVAPELFELLAASDRWREKSHGAFDPRVQALTELWSRSAKLDRLPTADELARVKAIMARPAWRLDAAAGKAEHLSVCPLSLNSIAKGYIIGRACEVALDPNRGIRGVLLNIGGDVRVVGDVGAKSRNRSASRRFRVGRADRPGRGSRSIGRDERQRTTRVSDSWQVVFAHIQSS